ncbi:MAG: hypothetical protein AB9866_10885 [Syntrophobacteraceae bacterium]
MRDLAAQRNVIEINDGASGDVHEVYYRMPTNEERAAYQNGAFAVKGRKLQARIFENRIKFGARVITGFKKGTLGIDGKAFSSEANDPDYREDWKTQLVENAGDIVTAIAAFVFEGTGRQAGDVDLETPPLDE